MNGDGFVATVDRRLGDGMGTVGRVRTGVKPECILCKTLRTRGVVFVFSTSSDGRLSTVKACGGTPSQSSKSSGARRFRLPEEDTDDEELGITVGTGCFSGVRVLNTGGCAVLRSGVFARANEEVEATRLNAEGVRERGVEGVYTGMGGMGGTWVIACVRVNGGAVALEEVGAIMEVAAGSAGEEVGREAFAAANFVCKFCTLRVRDSTLVASFFFSFNILYY